MYFIYIILLITFLLLITNINTENTDELEEKPFCSLYDECDKCILCNEYDNCNFYNILCYQKQSADYKITKNSPKNFDNFARWATLDYHFVTFALTGDYKLLLRYFRPYGATFVA